MSWPRFAQRDKRSGAIVIHTSESLLSQIYAMCDGSFSNVQFFLTLDEEEFAMYWRVHELAIEQQRKYIEAQQRKTRR